MCVCVFEYTSPSLPLSLSTFTKGCLDPGYCCLLFNGGYYHTVTHTPSFPLTFLPPPLPPFSDNDIVAQ